MNQEAKIELMNKERKAVEVEEEKVMGFLYQPHTISFLFVGAAVLIYYAFFQTDPSPHFSIKNAKLGVGAVVFLFLLFSMLQMRDGLLYRPHPAFWRVVMGCQVIYLLFLVFLLFQSVDFAREIMHFIDPALGQKLPDKSYAEDCRLYTPDNEESNFYNFKSTVNDEFILAHLLGWYGKAFIFRDARFCWCLSIAFELLELSLRHILMNFRECWWDHVILDVLVCNGLGIYLGMKTCRYLEMKEYDWAGMPKTKRWIMHSLDMFLPAKFPKYSWRVLSSPRRFFSISVLILLWALVEVNGFFLKFILWVPSAHYLVILRLVIWWFVCIPSMREFYQFATDNTCKKLGTMAWLCSAGILMETLIVMKFCSHLFNVEHPKVVVWSWAIGLLAFFTWAIIFYTTKSLNHNTASRKKKELAK